MKIDDKTKAKIKTIADQATKKRAQLAVDVPKAAAAATAAMNAAAAEAMAAQGITIDPNAMNNNGGFPGGRGGRGGGPGGGNNNPMTRQMLGQAMDALQADVDAAFLKLLDAKQKPRIKQIALQAKGTRAFSDPDPEVYEKLQMTDEQVEEIRTANNELRQGQFQAMRDLYAQFAPPDDNNNNNGNGGNNGGRRGGMPNLANLDEATRAKFEQQNQELQSKNASTSMAAVGKLLSASQKKAYNKMIGDPFDVAKLRTPTGAPGAPGAPATAAAKAAPPATKSAAAETSAAATTTPAKPARKSLREARGGN